VGEVLLVVSNEGVGSFDRVGEQKLVKEGIGISIFTIDVVLSLNPAPS
jgi:hypothetical protein